MISDKHCCESISMGLVGFLHIKCNSHALSYASTYVFRSTHIYVDLSVFSYQATNCILKASVVIKMCGSGLKHVGMQALDKKQSMGEAPQLE